MTGGRRVLFSTFGSGGDLFPLVPLAHHLAMSSHRVAFAVPRGLGLYLRALGLECYAVGSGAELAAPRDPQLLTGRFDGWASYRRLLETYRRPWLAEEVAAVDRLIRHWSPDVIVTMTYATGARIAALRGDVPHVGCTIYPQLTGVGTIVGRRYARRYLDEVRRLAGAELVGARGLDQLAWGSGPDVVVLQDPQLLVRGPTRELPDGIGYPYWDGVPVEPTDEDRLQAWFDRSDRPVVGVTLGSFIGAAPSRLWASAAPAARAAGVRLLGLNARAGGGLAGRGDTESVLAVGFVSTSSVAGRLAALVHHGGVGTTMAAIRAGVPAVVVPHAFDQPYMAWLIEQAGLGRASGLDDLTADLGAVLGSEAMHDRVARVASRLIPAQQTIEAATARVLDATRSREPMSARDG